MNMKHDMQSLSQPDVPAQPDRSPDEAAERYFEAMTNDCADPDDGTARTHEQVR
jgi:hypothetical protein